MTDTENDNLIQQIQEDPESAIELQRAETEKSWIIYRDGRFLIEVEMPGVALDRIIEEPSEEAIQERIEGHDTQTIPTEETWFGPMDTEDTKTGREE